MPIVGAQLDAHEEPTPTDPRLDFLEDERPPEPDRPRAPFDLIADALNGMGAQIPEEFRTAVAHLPYSAAANRYREWHAEQVSNALTAAGIPHDPTAVRSVLLWENLTDNESGDDLGNLPRLLSVLGLGGQWDDWVRQAEAPPPEPEPEPEAEPQIEDDVPDEEDRFGPVLAIAGPLTLASVAGGSFALPLKDLTLIRFFVEALSIHDTAGVVLAVTLPPDSDRARMPAPAEAGVGAVELTEDGFRVGLGNHLWFGRDDLKNQLGKGLARLLDHLPDGSTIDLAFALADKAALTQRYRGRVEGGAWRIGETYPPLTREALAGGIDLARYAARDREKHKLRDEAEAEAVVELAKRDPNLWDMKIKRKGRTVWCESDIVGHLPKVIFRHRFAAHWDVAAHDREAAQLEQARLEMQRKIRRAGAEAARRRAAPHDDEVLHRGKLGPYWRSDFARLEGLEQETRERIDAALDGLGFGRVGDLVAKKQRDIVLRTYASGDGLSYGLLMAKRTMYLGFEFFSRFADSSHLTTTTNAMAESRPEPQGLFQDPPGPGAAGALRQASVGHRTVPDAEGDRAGAAGRDAPGRGPGMRPGGGPPGGRLALDSDHLPPSGRGPGEDPRRLGRMPTAPLRNDRRPEGRPAVGGGPVGRGGRAPPGLRRPGHRGRRRAGRPRRRGGPVVARALPPRDRAREAVPLSRGGLRAGG